MVMGGGGECPSPMCVRVGDRQARRLLCGPVCSSVKSSGGWDVPQVWVRGLPPSAGLLLWRRGRFWYAPAPQQSNSLPALTCAFQTCGNHWREMWKRSPSSLWPTPRSNPRNLRGIDWPRKLFHVACLMRSSSKDLH